MFERPYIKTLLKHLDEPRRFIQVLTGPRQSGKTTLVTQVMEKWKKASVHFASGDSATGNSSGWIDLQWETIRIKTAGSGNNESLLVLDEIQKINDWSRHVKKNWDEDTKNKKPIKVIILGSSPLLIQKGLTESLAGRFERMYLPHWSLQEMNEAFGFSAEEFVWFGGYPGAATLVAEKERWKEYVHYALIDTTISKDILMLNRVDKPALLKQLFELGCLFSGQIFSFNKMLGQLQDAGNTTTLSHYLNLLETSGLLTGLQKFSDKPLKSRTSSPKLLVMNTALMSVFSSLEFPNIMSQKAIWGRHIESAVGAHLVNHSIGGGYGVYYWRQENDEVDFILKKNQKVIALEVKSGRDFSAGGMPVFDRIFQPYKKILVGTAGISWQDFLKINPVEIF